MNQQERKRFYKSKAWQVTRMKVLERDNYECVMCRKEGKVTTADRAILEVDHINELSKHPELALEETNLRVLCKYHHNLRHERFGHNKKKWDDEFW